MISGDRARVIDQILDMGKIIFCLKSVFMVDVGFELRPTTHGLSRTPFVKVRH